MPSITYGAGAFDRTTGNLPPLELINMFVEGAKTSENQVCLQSRPGLATSQTDGTGPIRALYREPGVLSGAIVSVSNATIYKANASVGSLAGTGPVSIAGTATEILVAAGSTMRRYNGTALSNVTFPDSAGVTAVCVINFLFVAIRGDSTYPGRFYWSAVNDGTSWDSLDYATAERVPDALLDIAALGDNIWLFGQSSLEVWQNTGNATIPFERIEQVAFDRGIIATGCWAKADNSLIFIGSDAVVYRAQADNPVRISDHWLEEKISASTAWNAFAFKYQGHEFVCIQIDAGSFLYDTVTQEWCEFQTSAGQWIARCAAMSGSTAYFGHNSTGAIMTFSGWKDLSADLERRFTTALPLASRLSIDSIRLWMNAGDAATVSMRYSRDAGRTWSAYIDISTGNSGDYRFVAEARRLGMFDFPGAMFESKCVSNTGLRISAVKVNDAGGGRSRP